MIIWTISVINYLELLANMCSFFTVTTRLWWSSRFSCVSNKSSHQVYMHILFNSENSCEEIQLTSTSIHIYTCSGDKFRPMVATEVGINRITCWIPTHFTVLQKDEAISYIVKTNIYFLCVIIVCLVHIVSSCQRSPGKVFLCAAKNYFGLKPSPTNAYQNTYIFILCHIEMVICRCTMWHILFTISCCHVPKYVTILISERAKFHP